MFDLMMVGGLVLEVPVMSFTNYSFVTMTWIIMWEGTWKKCAIDRPFMLTMLIVQEWTNFTQDEITMLEEINFIFHE